MKMKRILRLPVLLLVIAMLFGILTGCGQGQTASEAQASTPDGSVDAESQGKIEEPDVAYKTTNEKTFERQTAEGTFTVGTTYSTENYDPRTSSYTLGLQVVYDSLFVRNPSTQEIEGLLAEKWEYQDDTHLYIKIVDNATFSNGDPITADDVLYSLKLMHDESPRYATYFEHYLFDECYTISDTELVLVTDAAYGPSLAYLATRYASIVCQDFIENGTEEDMWSNPVVSGPYVVTENVSGSHSSYRLRDDYWGDTTGMPETITIKNYSEATTMFIDYENGALDAAFSISTNDAQRVMDGEVSNTNLIIAPASDVKALAMPEYVEAFDDIRVRQAIAHAIDADACAEVGLGIIQKSAHSTVPSNLDYYVDVGQYKYDPELSRQLLAEAGYSDGDIVLDLVVVNLETNVRFAEAVQAYLSNVGITVNVLSYDMTTAITHFQNNDTDLVLNAVGATTLDPDQMYSTTKITSDNGTVRITDDTFNAFLDAGCTTVDVKERAEAYANAQQWMYDNYRQVPICEVYSAYVYRDYISAMPVIDPDSPSLRFVEFAS